MSLKKENEIHRAVREGYAQIARESSSCCSPAESNCCCGSDLATSLSRAIGYTEQELAAVPAGANLGLGCGNPTALASLEEGEVVLDLGAGAGLDCFLAARQVGKRGKVIGVDMTPEMVARARENARGGGYGNVDFRLGEIENLPVADGTVDVIISNCVINLAPDKKQVFREAFRVLRPGGRLLVSDIVLRKRLPEGVRESVAAYVGCLAGALMKESYLRAIRAAGFKGVKVVEESLYSLDYLANDPTAQAVTQEMGLSPEEARDMATAVASVRVAAVKPAA